MKKVLSLVLAIAMVLSSMSFAFGATFNDIADTDYQKAIETLEALGVITGYDDGTYRPEKTITRAETAKLMVQLLGYGDVVSGQKSNFSDTQGHWADEWIAIAAGRGIVVGTGNGKFNPEGLVTYDQVLTMLVRGLGYTDTCNELKNMTWPTNFKVKAAELNITKSVDMTAVQADRGGVAQAMFNALEQQLVKINSDGDVVREYVSTVDNDKTPVKLVSRIAVPKYNFEVGFEQLDPDSKKYAGDKVDLTQYLFQSIEAYCDKNDEDTVVYVGKTNSLTSSGKFGSAKFDEDGNLKSLKIKDGYEFDVKNTLVSYNNDELGIDEIDKDTDLKNAKITVVLDEEETRVKDGAKAAGLVIMKASAYDQVEEEYKADATEIDNIYLPVDSKKVDAANLIVKGDADKLEDIEVNDILSAYAPFDQDPTDDTPDKLTLVVTREVLEGKVTGTASGAYYIDRVKKDYNDYLNLGELAVGDEGTFYLDDEGRIIAYSGEMDNSTYAVVYDDIIEGEYRVTSRGVSVTKAPKIKLATSSNENISYAFDVDLEEGKSGVEVVDEFKDLFTVKPDAGKQTGTIEFDKDFGDLFYKVNEKDTESYGKLISYDLNKNSEITKFALVGRKLNEVKTSSSSFVLASNAVIFDREGKVIKESDLGSTVSGYAVYKNSKIVALLTDKAAEGTSYYAYVTAKYKDSDEDGDEVQRLTAYVQGKKTTTLLTNGKGMITDVYKFYTLTLNDDGVVIDAKMISDKFDEGVITDIDAKNSTFKIVTKTYYYDQGAATIIELDADKDATIVNKLSGIKEKTTIQYLADKDNVVGYIVVGEKVEDTDEETEITGLVTYIDANDKSVAKQTIVKGDTLDLDVKFNNDSTTNVSIPAGNITAQIVNNKTGAVTVATGVETNAIVALAGKTANLGTIDNTIATEGLYTIVVTVKDANNKIYEGELALTVLNTDASVSAVKVKGVAATGTYAVELPFGTDLTKVVAADVVVTPTDANAKVTEIKTADNGTTWTAVVTAEDGVTKTNVTINMTVAAASTDSTLKALTVGGIAQVVPTTPFDVAINLPAGTTATPVVTAVANHAGAKVVITPATDVTATDGIANVTTIVVTAEDASTTTYTVTFTVTP